MLYSVVYFLTFENLKNSFTKNDFSRLRRGKIQKFESGKNLICDFTTQRFSELQANFSYGHSLAEQEHQFGDCGF